MEQKKDKGILKSTLMKLFHMQNWAENSIFKMWYLIFGHRKFQLLIWVQSRCDVIYWIFLKNDRIVPVSTFVLKEKLLCELLCLVILWKFCCRRIKELRSMHSVSYCFKTIELKISVKLNYSFFIYFIFSCMFCIWM